MAVNPFQTQNYNIKNPFLEGGATGMPQPPIGPEVNLRGDAANGFSGSLTSKSLSNAVMQKPTVSGGKSGNVFADMLQHSMTLGNVPNQKMKKIVTRGGPFAPTPSPVGSGPITPGQPRPTDPRGPSMNPRGPSAPDAISSGYDENGQPLFLSYLGSARDGERPFPIDPPTTPGPGVEDVPWDRSRRRRSVGQGGPAVTVTEQAPPSNIAQIGPPSDYAEAARKYSQELTQAWGTPIAVTEVDVRRYNNRDAMDMDFATWYQQNGGVEWNTNNPEAMSAYWRSQPGYENVNPQAIQQYDAYKKSAQGDKSLDFDQYYDIYLRNFGDRRAPRNNEDPRIAALWYSRFVPGGGVTAQDVDAYRANPRGVDFATWWSQGNRGSGRSSVNPAWEARDWGGGARPGRAYQRSLGPGPPPIDTTTPLSAPSGPGTGTPTTPATQGTGTSTSTGTGSSTSTTTQTPTTPTLMNFNDVLKNVIEETSDRFDPLFQKQRRDVSRELTADFANKNLLRSGGFGESLTGAMSDLTAEQGAILGKEISEQTKNMTQLATQKYVAELGVMVQQEQIRTNADLERAAQELQRYGIDKNDLLDRYKAELGLKGQMYSADRGVDAAALHAAASQAAAGAQAAAARYDADVRRELGILGYDVERENNIMRYILGIGALGPEWAKWIMSSDPAGLMPNGFGNVVTVR